MTDDSKTLDERRLKAFLGARRADWEQDEADITSLVPGGKPLPDDLRLLHEHRALSLRLRQTEKIVGNPIGREEADAEAARLLSGDSQEALAALTATLLEFRKRPEQSSEE